MENLNGLVELFIGKTFTVPVGSLLLVFSFFAWFVLYEKHKWGFLAAYAFMFYWGFIVERMYWVNLFGDNTVGLVLYIFSALGIGVMGVVGLFQESH